MSIFEQRANIKFCELLGKSATETVQMLQQAHGDQALSPSVVFAWHRQFREGRVVGVDVNDISNDPVKEEQEEQPVARKKWGAEKSQKESREAPGDEADDHVSGEMKNMNSASVKEEQEDQPVAKKKRGAGKSQERRDAPSDEEDNKG